MIAAIAITRVEDPLHLRFRKGQRRLLLYLRCLHGPRDRPLGLRRVGRGDHEAIALGREPGQRGCALSILVRDRPRELLEELQRRGVVCDFREPNVIRVAPVPLYNSFQDVWTFARVLGKSNEQ